MKGLALTRPGQVAAPRGATSSICAFSPAVVRGGARCSQVEEPGNVFPPTPNQCRVGGSIVLVLPRGAGAFPRSAATTCWFFRGAQAPGGIFPSLSFSLSPSSLGSIFIFLSKT